MGRVNGLSSFAGDDYRDGMEADFGTIEGSLVAHSVGFFGAFCSGRVHSYPTSVNSRVVWGHYGVGGF